MSFAGFFRKFFFELRFAKLVKLAPNCELRIANCELRIANCELRIANCELRIANCELRIANFAARGLICQALLRKFAVFFAALRVAYQYNCNMTF